MRFAGVYLPPFLILLSFSAMGQEATVSNVTFSQAAGGSGTQVDIYYDLASPGGNCTVTAALSTDGGATFPYPVAGATGDIGENVAPGPGRHLVWNVSANLPNQVVGGAVIRIVASLPDPGATYALGYSDITFVDYARGRNVPAQVWYPATAAGQDTPVAGGGGVTFPAIVFGHGTGSTIASYEYLWLGLVPSGYIFVMLNTETSITASTTNFAQDMQFLANQLQAEGANPASRFYQRVARPTALMGHSMGGAGAMYASGLYNGNGVVTTIVPIACADMSLNIAGTAAPYVAIPTLFISGSLDCMAPVSLQTPMFDAMPANCKYLISITGAGHCQFSKNQTWCDTGETIMGCSGAAFIDRGYQMSLVLSLAKPWLDFKLKGLDSGRAQFLGNLAYYQSTGEMTQPRTGTCTFGNWAVSSAGSLDTQPPTGTILINNNQSVTNNAAVTLGLTWSDGAGPGVVRMRFSDDGAHWTAWEPLKATRAYTLPEPDGYHTVRVQYRDAVGNRSAVFNDYIRLDRVPPTGTIIINGGAATTATTSVTLGLTWSDGAGSGVVRMRFSDNGAHWTLWEPLKTPRAYTLPEGNGYHTVRAQYRDAGGNNSAAFNDYIKLVAPLP